MTKQHKAFLDKLRESGEINMYGAAPYLAEEFDITIPEARAILSEWMHSFEENDPDICKRCGYHETRCKCMPKLAPLTN